jgi:hypothetical protein
MDSTTPQILFTAVSGNAKTGPIPTTMSKPETCPDSCPLKNAGCYAKNGPTRFHWDRLDRGDTGIVWDRFIGEVKRIWKGSLWRHNVAGDLAGKGDEIDVAKLRQLVAANKGKMGFSYTHKSVLFGQFAASNRKAIAEANQKGFTINLSGNNLHHADTLASLGIGPVVSVVPENQKKNCKTPAGRRVVICPATIKDDVTCARCGLCANPKRDYIVGFPSHGIQKKKAEAVMRSFNCD